MKERSKSVLNYSELNGLGYIPIEELKKDQQKLNERMVGINLRLLRGMQSMKEGYSQLSNVLENTGYDRSHLYKHILIPVQDVKSNQTKKRFKATSNLTKRETIK